MKQQQRMINHRPYLDVEDIIKHYTEADGVPIQYVCTSEIDERNVVYDIFYRSDHSPHPEHGNRYFGLRAVKNPHTEETKVVIINADEIEGKNFALIQDDEGNYQYSRYVHEYLEFNGNMIDGGRQYCRFRGDIVPGICFRGRILDPGDMNE